VYWFYGINKEMLVLVREKFLFIKDLTIQSYIEISLLNARNNAVILKLALINEFIVFD
jgi:hypothetical protein